LGTQPNAVTQPKAYQYNVPVQQQPQQQQTFHLNPQFTNPNNFGYLQPPASAPVAPRYYAPAPIYRALVTD
jgi:hypothetical protein